MSTGALWTLERIEKMFAEQETENWALDYKRSIDKTRDVEELTKDVSSFANSGGGVLIYGIGEDREKHFPAEKHPINFNEITKEWLESQFDKITPKIAGLKIIPVFVDVETKVGYYVVVVPKGHTVHQAFDCKYYKRGIFKSDPMRHYEVMDVLGRSTLPRISLSIRLQIVSGNGIHFRCTLINESAKLIKHWKMQLEIPGVVCFGKNRIDVSHFVTSAVSNAKVSGVEATGAKYFDAYFLDDTVIFPQEIRSVVFSFKSHNQVIPDADFGDDTIVYVNVYADDMPCFYSEVPIASLVSDFGLMLFRLI